MSGLVAVMGLELETTEFDQTVTYAYNDILHSPTDDQITGATQKLQAGMLFKTKNWGGGGGGALTLYPDAICGVVSIPMYVNSLNQNALAFWPVFLPGTA